MPPPYTTVLYIGGSVFPEWMKACEDQAAIGTCETMHAPCVADALEALSTIPVDLAVLDQSLLGSSGIAAVTSMKRLVPALPILVLNTLPDLQPTDLLARLGVVMCPAPEAQIKLFDALMHFANRRREQLDLAVNDPLSRLLQALDRAPASAALVDCDSRIVWSNRTFYRSANRFDYPPVGLLLADVLPGLALDRLNGQLQGSAPFTLSNLPFAHTGSDGVGAAWQLVGFPLVETRPGRLWMLLGQDYTAYNQLLAQHNDLVCMLAHDLRLPLYGAQRILETLRAQATLEEIPDGDQALALLLKSTGSQLKKIDNLISIYLYEFGAHVLNLQEVDVTDVITDCLAELRAEAQTRGVALNSRGTENLATVTGDRAELSCLLHQVIGNSIQFSSSGAAVDVASANEGKCVVITVTDTGLGLTEDKLLRVTQGIAHDTTGSARCSGHGLGLYLARLIAEAHHGSITITSMPHTRTVATIRIPVKEQFN